MSLYEGNEFSCNGKLKARHVEVYLLAVLVWYYSNMIIAYF